MRKDADRTIESQSNVGAAFGFGILFGMAAFFVVSLRMYTNVAVLF